jgi:hypothetical protein
MPTPDDMRWFKTNFQTKLEAGLQGTPYTVDFMTALACQETGEVFPKLRQNDLSLDRILELCVGDTLDAPRRSVDAFPKNKTDLVAHHPKGQEIFHLARQALIDMAQFVKEYQGVASDHHPDKFCHGFGIFQFDIQHCKTDPDYFLQKRYANFDECLKKAIGELEPARRAIGLPGDRPLTDHELAFVAIAYNIGPGRFRASRGLQQGFAPKDEHGKVVGPFYGEQFFDFMQKSKTVTADAGSATTTPTTPPTTNTTTTATFTVTASGLNLRSSALFDPNDPKKNFQVTLPKGQKVRAVSDQIVNGFREVETDFQGKHFRGFCSAKFLTQVLGTSG